MVKVSYNGTVLAESSETVIVEGNHYFPPSSVHKDFFQGSSTSSVCPWKGVASYYNAVIDGKVTKDIAWYYANPSPKAKHIKDYIAFYKNKVTIV